MIMLAIAYRTFDGKRTVRMYIPQESTMQAYADAALAKVNYSFKDV